MKINPQSLTLRFSIFYAIVISILISLFIASSFWFADSLLRNQLDRILQSDSDALIEIYELGGLEDVKQILSYRLKNVDKNETIYLLTNDIYEPVLGNIPAWPKNVSQDKIWDDADLLGHESIERDIRYLRTEFDNGWHLLIGRETVYLEFLENQATIGTIIILFGIIFIGIMSGLYLHQKLNLKLSLISLKCEDIRNGDLSIRFPVSRKGDEIDKLTNTLNEMLDQVQSLMFDIQHITDNIAHDLRTPLTRIRNRTEQLSGEVIGDEVQKSIYLTIEQIDDLLSTFNSMLQISHIETRPFDIEFERLNLKVVLEDCIDFYEVLAEEKKQKIKLSIESDVHIHGNRNLIFQTLGNILENAIKYSGDATTITVNLMVIDHKCCIQILDQGDGIPVSEFKNITKRFYRLDKSRNTSGSGLGLSLVNAIVKLHHGSLSFKNQNGLCVSLNLPIIL